MKTILILSIVSIASFKSLRDTTTNNNKFALNFAMLKQNMDRLIFQQDGIKDAIIIRGSMFCNPEWKPVDIKNNSTSKFLTITVSETTERPGSTLPPSVKTLVFSKLAPQEQRQLGCSGCGSTTSGQLCVKYKVIAAVYATP